MWCKRLFIYSSFPVALAVLSGAGCRPAEQITAYSVPKPDSIIPSGEEKLTPANRTERKPAAAAVPARMLAAIFITEKSGWFFKATGDIEKLAAKEAEFKQFLESVRFPDEQKPTWKLPEGWVDRGEGSEFRLTTITMGDDAPPLELAVSRLDRSVPDERGFVLININRWRGQLGLSQLDPDELADSTTKLEIDGKNCYVLNAVGEMAAGGGMRPPFAGASPTTTSLPPETAGKAPAQESELKYEKPAGWQDGKLSQFRQAAFEVKAEDEQVEITVTTVPLGTGTLLANVNRWREQVGQKPIQEADLDTSVKTIPVGDKEGKYVDLTEGASGKGLLGVILESGNRMWFVKLIGNADLAKREQTNFEAFVKSLHVP
jgi:hypothetical protein